MAIDAPQPATLAGYSARQVAVWLDAPPAPRRDWVRAKAYIPNRYRGLVPTVVKVERAEAEALGLEIEEETN